MQRLHKFAYRRPLGISLLVLGLLLTVSGGMQYAFFEKPSYQEVLGAMFVPTPTASNAVSPASSAQASPRVTPTVTPTPRITFGPPAPVATSKTVSQTITPTAAMNGLTLPAGRQEPSTTITLTPTPTTNISQDAPTTTPPAGESPTATPTPQPAKHTIAAAIESTTVVMFTVTPTLTETPSPTPDTSATDDTVWYQLATCESNQHWNDNTGNGYYGGLQFALGTWAAYGGSGRPDQASAEEQITIGKKLQAARGWSPWGGCAHRLGLL